MTRWPNRRSVLKSIAAAPATLAMPACSTGLLDAEYIVLGAGLSGLYAARLLADAGKDVLVIEGSKRIGGRLYTLDRGDGQFSEAGGEQVGAGYARIRHVADELDVSILPNKNPRAETLLHFRGQSIRAEEWPEHQSNPFPDALKKMSPSALLGQLAFRDNPFDDVYDWKTHSDTDISAQDWLLEKGLSRQAIDTVNIGLNANDVESYAMRNLFRTMRLYSQDSAMGPSGYFENGAQSLPEAMAADLPRKVRTGQVVRRIVSGQQGVQLSTTRGRTFRSAYLIAAVPFPVLAKMTLSISRESEQKRAMTGLPYTQILQVHFKADEPFWENDGLPSNMWTDSPLERIFADRDANNKPTGLMRAWINGSGASTLNEKTDEELEALCKDEMKRIRPASAGHISVDKIIRWTDSNPLAGGAYMHWAPGQARKWADVMGKPTDRVYFCGEHLSQTYTGMEGAMESAENVAFRILDI